ncbi:Ktr system potassium uptake protein D [Oceanobacillus arenosus]|uniref:Ktr system potassium uptake protein D n=1 Tax=Oceanobacillus arenosus TaxID=1229153 RepID=A0A3D8PRR0_9BACI|nr:TrkH family potassium uptake protein [Oceanobacillus arenosus]RDW18402.1 Ktr system potassium uptake protein D [Oceanobacillus arenosus]
MKYIHFHHQWLNKRTPAQLLLLFYLLSIIISTAALSLPIAYQDGVEVEFIDILFTAVSAISVTGLSTISIVDTLSTTGIIILDIILHFGTIGIMASGTFIWLLIGKKIGLRERRLIMTDQNQTSFQGMVRLTKQIVLILLVIEVIAFLILGTYLLNYYPTAKEAYFHGFFGTISALSNAGFDITGASLLPYSHDYFVQFIIMLLIIFGAIGFPVLIEVKEYLFARYEKRRALRFSLFTKVTTTTFFILIFAGACIIWLLDSNDFFAGKSWHEALFYALFQSVTTRSGGMSTMDINLLSEENHLFISFLMFIGASPSSAGGGIRTTTFALVLIFIFTYARGGGSIRLFKREVYEEDLLKAVMVTLVASAMVLVSVLLISSLEPFSLMQVIFEVTSAFGTVGLSLGITSDLSNASKILLMLLMFIGRLGLFTFILMFRKNKQGGEFHYPKEKIIIG